MNNRTIDPESFTVIATVRNEKNTISKFVDSLLNQSLTPNEIIIVDGESTDGTNEILRKYELDGKIRLYTKNCNIAQGRNFAIQNASNELIAVTDAGCSVNKNWLKEIARAFSSSEQPDVVAGNFKFECHSRFEQAVVLATFNPDRENTEAAKYYPSSRSVAFKKSAWKKAKGYPEWLYAAEDTLFNIRLRQLGYKFVFAKDAFVTWRPRETWKALAKQRFNFSRGNARVGIGTVGYLANIQYHSYILLPLLLSFYTPWLVMLSALPLFYHIKNNLWKQAEKAGKKTNSILMQYYVLLVMEFVRIIGMLGFIRGRLDRILDKRFLESQVNWMGIQSLDEIDN